MDVLQAIILGIVEGATEFLPVSSTGHLIVVSQWLGIEQTKINIAFEVIIQLAAILAIFANYKDKFTVSHLNLWIKILIAFLPLAIVGFIFKDQIEALFLSKIVVPIMFIIGGIVASYVFLSASIAYLITLYLLYIALIIFALALIAWILRGIRDFFRKLFSFR